jgi:hypothetical protein
MMHISCILRGEKNIEKGEKPTVPIFVSIGTVKTKLPAMIFA